MITVSITDTKKSLTLKVEGHSNYAEQGKDIVCASASILAYTMAQNAMYMFSNHQLKCMPVLNLVEGDTEITITPKQQFYEEGFHAYFLASLGYSLLAKSYPENVRYIGFE